MNNSIKEVKIMSLMDVVIGTATNSEGSKLFHAIDDCFNKNLKVELSLKNSSPMSSSFLNSSVGELVEKYGYGKVTELLSFKNVSRFNADNIKKYFQVLKEFA